jgi:predicted NUDIX family NTP pyrophosphohydrolase
MTAGRRSAGLLLHRTVAVDAGEQLQVLIAHPGGPLWAKRDAGAWSIPKGEYDTGEDPFAAACREFTEELGSPAPTGETRELGEVRQRGGKVVVAWAVAADFDATSVTSNTFELQWPPRSGRLQRFPEIDRAAWVDIATAREKLVAAQAEFLDRLCGALREV